MKRLVLLAVLTIITGCADHDIGKLSTLAPTEKTGEYLWKTHADPVYPIDSQKAEAERLSQLSRLMAMNSYCGGKYKIVSRTPVLKVKASIGDLYDLFYSIRCSSAS